MDLNKDFTIIIPTFHEAKNIPELLWRISQINFGDRCFEVIVVDDNSEDGTVEIANSLSAKYPWLKLIVRHGEKSLSLSVIDGFKNASYPILVVMDADLSHPPEKIPEMLTALSDPNVDLVIGSRYIEGGSIDEKWPITRKLVSRLSGTLARILISSNVKDPLSGFLALRRNTFFSGTSFEPVGWKIGLEIIIKCQCKKIIEIPIRFSQRSSGNSKLNFKVAFNYFRHVIRLTRYKLFYSKQ